MLLRHGCKIMQITYYKKLYERIEYLKSHSCDYMSTELYNKWSLDFDIEKLIEDYKYWACYFSINNYQYNNSVYSYTKAVLEIIKNEIKVLTRIKKENLSYGINESKELKKFNLAIQQSRRFEELNDYINEYEWTDQERIYISIELNLKIARSQTGGSPMLEGLNGRADECINKEYCNSCIMQNEIRATNPYTICFSLEI